MGNSILEYPCLNIIHDSRMSDRLEPLLTEFAEQGITDYKLWNPIEDKNSVIRSINLSHKQIVQDAKDKGLNQVCIGEDDLYFSAPKGWEWFLKNKPDSFEMYFWGSYIVPLTNKKVVGFQLYIIDNSFFDRFLGIPENVHIDTYMDELKGDYKFCYPFSALQRSCWSANNKAICNYNSALRPEDIWKGYHS